MLTALVPLIRPIHRGTAWLSNKALQLESWAACWVDLFDGAEW